MMGKRGVLICFGIETYPEGGDRCGKSTQVDLLAQKMDAAVFKFPDRTSLTGHMIQDYLQGKNMDDHAVHLLFSANRWETKYSG